MHAECPRRGSGERDRYHFSQAVALRHVYRRAAAVLPSEEEEDGAAQLSLVLDAKSALCVEGAVMDIVELP